MASPASPLPLAGVKVVELGQLIAGPFAGKTLADFGAEVVKIEPPGEGDPLRKWRLLYQGTSVWWQVQSRNKESIVAGPTKARGPRDCSAAHPRRRCRDREFPPRHYGELGPRLG